MALSMGGRPGMVSIMSCANQAHPSLLPRPQRASTGCTWIAFLLLAGAGAGCGFGTESERAYFAAREAERLQQLELRDAVVAETPEVEVLSLVTDDAAPDGSGTTGDWVKRAANETGGQLLFPRWQVDRRGANRYEVKYTYTLIDSTKHLSRRGFLWNVDTALKVVGKPHPLVLAEPARAGRTFNQQQERRISEEEASLE